MKCPKCEFVSFDSQDTCKRCGYSFKTGKSGKKISVFSKIKEKFSKPSLVKATGSRGALETEPELSEDEAVPEGAATTSPKAAVDDSTTVEEVFDDQFDNLFGEDKNAIKGGDDDAIMITAKDVHSEAADDDDMIPDYGFDDPYAEVLIPPPDDDDELFKEDNGSVDRYVTPQGDTTYGESSSEEKSPAPQEKAPDESVPEASDTSKESAQKEPVVEKDETGEPESGDTSKDAGTSDEDKDAQDFMKQLLTDD